MDQRSQDNAKARAEVAVNFRRFAGWSLNTSDELRRLLQGPVGLVRWAFVREAAQIGTKRVVDAFEEVVVKPLAVGCVRAAGAILGAAPLAPRAAYDEALLIAQYGPAIPASVRAALDASKTE